jgi:hypothetical protein
MLNTSVGNPNQFKYRYIFFEMYDLPRAGTTLHSTLTSNHPNYHFFGIYSLNTLHLFKFNSNYQVKTFQSQNDKSKFAYYVYETLTKCKD